MVVVLLLLVVVRERGDRSTSAGLDSTASVRRVPDCPPRDVRDLAVPRSESRRSVAASAGGTIAGSVFGSVVDDVGSVALEGIDDVLAKLRSDFEVRCQMSVVSNQRLMSQLGEVSKH